MAWGNGSWAIIKRTSCGRWTTVRLPESRRACRRLALDEHKAGFGHFINGVFTKPGDLFDVFQSREPAKNALRAFRKAIEETIDAIPPRRERPNQNGRRSPASRRLRSISPLPRAPCCKRERFLTQFWKRSTTAKPILAVPRDIDISAGRRHFLSITPVGRRPDRQASSRRPKPVGVGGQIIPWNFPLLMLAWKIRAGARGRQHGCPEAGGIHASDRARLRRHLCRDGAASWRGQYRHRRPGRPRPLW